MLKPPATFTLALSLICAAFMVAAAACGSSDNYNKGAAGQPSVAAGTVLVDGSVALKPLLQAAADKSAGAGGSRASIGISGETAAFASLCHNDVDIVSSTRPIKTAEYQACVDAGQKVVEVPVAFDALAVAVSPQNTWATCLTTSQLRKMWDQGSTVRTWSDLDPSFPAEPITFVSPPTYAADFDYFTETINGTTDRLRADGSVVFNESDDALAQLVANDRNATSFFSYTYFASNPGKLTVVMVDKDIDAQGQPASQGAHTCQALTEDSARTRAYPLSRPLYLYLTAKSAKKAAVNAFAEYVISNPDVVSAAGYLTPQSVTTQQALTNLRAAK